MKIVILAYHFPVRSETFIVQHALGLARRGHKVTVIADGLGPGLDTSELSILSSQGVNHVFCKEPSKSRFLRYIQLVWWLFCYPRQIQKLMRKTAWGVTELYRAWQEMNSIQYLQPDVVHVHYGLKAGALAEFENLQPFVVTWHGFDANVIPRTRGEAMYSGLFEKSWTHTVGSEYMWQRLLQLGAASTQLRKMPMGVDINKFDYEKRHLASSSPFKIISVGRLDEMKGHQYLIEAVHRMKERGGDVELRIIGEGPLRPKIEAQIESLECKGYVKLLGAQSSERVLVELQKADCFALTGVEAQNGRVETQGVVFIEAQSVGLPVIACNVGGVAESLIDGETGVLCEPRNVEQIVEALMFYKKSAKTRQEYGAAGRMFVEEKFSIEKMLTSFEGLYLKVLNSKTEGGQG